MSELAVSILRGEEWAEYLVPLQRHQTVLDLVTWIQRHRDPSLAYRFACRVGMCGSCAMTVNGRPRWTCRTRVEDVAENAHLRLEPLANFPVIKDLTVDMEPFFQQHERAVARFFPGGGDGDFACVSPGSPARQRADAGIECIGCGVCAAACETVAAFPGYLGPAALNRVWTLVNDSRDGAGRARLAAVAGDFGAHGCASHQECSEVCPKHLDLAGAIAALKRTAFRAALTGGR
ncbi:MAG TPA: succinate dehydrogenase/fumarate reductase iron-sulfur subunit [Rhodospirillaceae bacterium]|nr:succinate dehydrogenase/fumarate reductase iron-sulfur subunit [Rhodospirillaceae bacterium]